MPFNGAGVFTAVAGNPVVTGTVISSTVQNNTISDICNNGLTDCITKDGQSTPTANIPMGGFRILSLGAGVAASDAANVGQTAGRLLRLLVYTNVSGTQFVSINGAAPTTTGATTYTPLATMAFVLASVQGGGGAGGGATNPTVGNVSLGAPGKSGAFGKSIFVASTVGVSQAVSVGAGGAAAAGGTGATGTTSSFGALLSSPGGTGGGVSNNVAVPIVLGNGSTTALPTGSNIYATPGVAGTSSVAINATLAGMWGGSGGGTVFGPEGSQNAGNTNGILASTIGGGGSGVVLINGGGTASGGAGAPGIVIIEEYA